MGQGVHSLSCTAVVTLMTTADPLASLSLHTTMQGTECVGFSPTRQDICLRAKREAKREVFGESHARRASRAASYYANDRSRGADF